MKDIESAGVVLPAENAAVRTRGSERGAARWRGARLTLGTLAVATCGFGVYGLLSDRRVSDPLPVLCWMAGVLLVHDGLLLPVIVLIGAGLGVLLPVGPRDVVRGGLVVAAVTTVVALPLLVRKGVIRNPSMLPLDYVRNWLLLVGAIALVTAALALSRARRPRPDERRVD